MASTMRFDTWQNSLGLGTTGIHSSGHFYSPGAVVQVQEFRGGSEVSSTGPQVTICTGSFTTKLPGSKLYMLYYTGQLALSKVDTNPELKFLVDGVDQGLDTDHVFYGMGTGIRPFLTVPLITSAVPTAGVHTVTVTGGTYNSGTVTYNYQASSGTEPRRSRLIVMEIAQ